MKKEIIAIALILGLSPSICCYSQPIDFSGRNTQLSVDINGDGQKEKISLDAKLDYGEYDGEVGVDATIFSIKAMFENGKTVVLENAAKRDDGNHPASLIDIRISEKIPSMIGIEHGYGAHSTVLYIYQYQSREIVKKLKIFCDFPKIEIKDTDNDGVKEIVAYSRDYGNNPTRDNIIETYKYADNEWELISVYRTFDEEYVLLEEWIN